MSDPIHKAYTLRRLADSNTSFDPFEHVTVGAHVRPTRQRRSAPPQAVSRTAGGSNPASTLRLSAPQNAVCVVRVRRSPRSLERTNSAVPTPGKRREV